MRARRLRRLRLLACVFLLGALTTGGSCLAAEPASLATASRGNFASEFVMDWLERAEHARATEPQWVSPLVTVTPRLEQSLLRFDQSLQAEPRGAEQRVFAPKVKLIPLESFEFDVSAPAYISSRGHDKKRRRRNLDAWGDMSLLVKYRLLSANETSGNYIVTFFTGVTLPEPSGFGTERMVFSPTIAMGKGWGKFDIQSTLGVSVPDSGMVRLGTPLSFNTALQYCVLDEIWPELEFNYTWWANGQKTGENSLFLTPGILLGRFPIWRTFNFTVGTGIQVAVTRHRSSNLNWLSSGRLAF